MGPLTPTEEFVLLSVYQLCGNGYGITIRRHIEGIMQKRFSVGAVYVPLERLENKGLLTSYMGEPTSARGGRRKRFYKITPDGIAALKETKRLRDTFWANTSDLEAPHPSLT